jgi:hypothetical protein
MAAGKRTRFALVFNGVRVPAMGGDFLKELDVIKAEGCEHDGKQFVIFTTRKPRKAADVLSAVSAFNATTEDKMHLIAHEDGPEVVVFDRGNCYRTHSICKIIQEAMSTGKDVSWAWSLVVDSESKQKRVASELETDMVETSILPSAAKRVALPREVVDLCCVIGVYVSVSMPRIALTKLCPQTGVDADPLSTDASTTKKTTSGEKKRKSSHQKENAAPNGGQRGEMMAKDVVVLLVKEITRSKDETIQTKNQLIELLMSQRREGYAGALE